MKNKKIFTSVQCKGDKTYDALLNCRVRNLKLLALNGSAVSHGHSHGCC